MQLKNLYYLFFALIFLSSCEIDESPTPPDTSETFAGGIFVLNEGNFGSGNSSVSFLDPKTEEITHNIFSDANGSSLGDTATDIGFFEDLAFVVVNVSNTIEIVDRNTFVTVATINTNLENPRKIAFLDGLAYVTNWGDGSDPEDDYVAVFDAESFELITKISVEEGPEAILAEGNRIFVAHQGGWNFNNSISVISANEVEKTIEVGEVPNSLTVGNGFLWVSSSGLPDYADAGATAGSISKIDISTLEVVQEYNFQDVQNYPKNVSFDNSRVFYTMVDGVYSFDATETSLPATPDFILNEAVFLYGFAVYGGKVYAASANSDFTGNGKLMVYEAAGADRLQMYETGINPNGIFFNE